MSAFGIIRLGQAQRLERNLQKLRSEAALARFVARADDDEATGYVSGLEKAIEIMEGEGA